MSIQTDKAKKEIKEAAEEAVKVIADAAQKAAREVVIATSEAAKINSSKNAEDHDSLITLIGAVASIDQKFCEKFADLKTDIKAINDGTTTQLADHEARLRTVEKEGEDHAIVKKVVYGAVSFILLAVLSAIVYLVLKSSPHSIAI